MRTVPKLAELAFAAFFVSVGAGCASAPLHTEAATSEIRAAEAVGATKVPRAALLLQLAREELEAANALAAQGKAEEGASLLLRAEVDAVLAVALTREHAAKMEAAEARKLLEEVKASRDEPAKIEIPAGEGASP